MEGNGINKESGATEIFRFIKEKHDSPGENDIRDLYDTITPSYDKFGEVFLRNFADVGIASAVSVGAGAIHVHRAGKNLTIKGILYTGPRKVVSILDEYCSTKNVSILECGAGTGLIGEQLYESGYKNVIGVDVSQKSLDIAEQKGVYKKLICDEILPKGMPFKDDEFDVVICSGCIAPGHISPECFLEWTRIVKPGGFVIIVLRRCYVELQKPREYLHSAKLGESFQTEIRNLEISKRWEVVLRQTFPGYIYEDGLLNDGIAVVCKVLNNP